MLSAAGLESTPSEFALRAFADRLDSARVQWLAFRAHRRAMECGETIVQRPLVADVGCSYLQAPIGAALVGVAAPRELRVDER